MHMLYGMNRFKIRMIAAHGISMFGLVQIEHEVKYKTKSNHYNVLPKLRSLSF